MDIDTRLSQLLSSKPMVPDYESKMSHLGRMMQHQTIRKESEKKTPNSIILNLGQPNSCSMPFSHITLRMKDGHELQVDTELIEHLSLYNSSTGLKQLRDFMRHVQEEEHKPPQVTMKDHPSNFDLCIIPGVTQGLQSFLKATVECDGSDTVLMEDVCYISFINNLKTHDINVQGVQYDLDGMIPEALEDTLSNWHQQHPDKNFPKVLYTITTASNPIGHNWSLSRMVDIYSICRKYDLLIIDDGAYYFLLYGERDRSFQSFDIDGRVIRFDSFSKIIGAGYRLGWVSGPAFLVDKININNQLTSIHASIASQVIIYSMLKHWGYDGFQDHTRSVANFYKQRAEVVKDACDKYLTGLATWTKPKGGMFTWITINDVTDSSDVVKALAEKDIRLLKGEWFQTDLRANNCIRLCYSLASEDGLVEAIKCLGDCIRKVISDKEV